MPDYVYSPGRDGYYYPITTSASTTGNIAWNTTYASGSSVVGPYSWQAGRDTLPALPARPRTNRERLAAEVDKVCALARK